MIGDPGKMTGRLGVWVKTGTSDVPDHPPDGWKELTSSTKLASGQAVLWGCICEVIIAQVVKPSRQTYLDKDENGDWVRKERSRLKTRIPEDQQNKFPTITIGWCDPFPISTQAELDKLKSLL